MLLKLLFLFTAVPLIELYILLWITDKTQSVPFTFGLVLVTGIVGAGLARWQGVRSWRRIGQQLQQGQMPGDALLDSLCILIAGALLVTPGVLTDAVGFGLLIPPIRALIKRRITARLKANIVTPPGFQPTWDHDEIIESRLIDPSEEQQ